MGRNGGVWVGVRACRRCAAGHEGSAVEDDVGMELERRGVVEYSRREFCLVWRAW